MFHCRSFRRRIAPSRLCPGISLIIANSCIRLPFEAIVTGSGLVERTSSEKERTVTFLASPHTRSSELQNRRHRRRIFHCPQLESDFLEDRLRGQVVAQNLSRQTLELFLARDSRHAGEKFSSESSSLPRIGYKDGRFCFATIDRAESSDA